MAFKNCHRFMTFENCHNPKNCLFPPKTRILAFMTVFSLLSIWVTVNCHGISFLEWQLTTTHDNSLYIYLRRELFGNVIKVSY